MKLSELFEGLFEELFEERKNPKLNYKQSAWDKLKQYENDDNIFIHFTNHIPSKNDPTQHNTYDMSKVQIKIGVNPNGYDFTPAGIYAYNLRQYIKENGHIFGSTDDDKPFASNYPYIIVFKPINGSNVINMANYTENHWNNDYKKLLKLYPHYKNIIDHSINYTKISGAIGKLWQSTKVLANENHSDFPKYELESTNPMKWNNIFRKLGYDGFIDNGVGAYTTESHYSQSVFFSKPSIKVLDIITKQNPTMTNDEYLNYIKTSKENFNKNISLIKDDSTNIEKINPSSYGYEELCMMVVQNDVEDLYLIPEKYRTPKICLFCLKSQDFEFCFDWIPNRFIDSEILKLANFNNPAKREKLFDLLFKYPSFRKKLAFRNDGFTDEHYILFKKYNHVTTRTALLELPPNAKTEIRKVFKSEFRFLNNIPK